MLAQTGYEMEITDITGMLSLLIAIVGIFLIMRQIVMSRISVEADHLRRKKESTFNGYNEIREDFRRLNKEILHELNLQYDSSLEQHHFDTIRENQDLTEKLRTLLSYIERMAVGVKNDIYDLNILLDLSGTPFICAFERYYTYIRESRQRSITFYQEAENFINILRNLREDRIEEIRKKRI